MITKASIRNFKCLREVQIDLERFTVFVGPNASGKSSILQALDFLCRAFRLEQLPNLDNELIPMLSRGATDPIELAADYSGKAYRYRSPSSPISGRTYVATSLAASDWKERQLELAGSFPLPHSVPLRLEASKLLVPDPAQNDASVIAPDGTGLHTALMNMVLNDPDTWQKLQVDLKQIIPGIRRIRHSKASHIAGPYTLLFDTIGADSVPAAHVSEGTLFVLGWLAAIYLAGRPSLILLDDLDRALHPKAQRDLIALLRGLLDTIPDLQILATTHSPYLLDHMEPGEVRMTALAADGATMCAPLASHPDFTKWKNELVPGEMWSVFGEKWVVGVEVGK